MSDPNQMGHDEATHWGARWVAMGVVWVVLVAALLFFPPWGG